MFECFVNLFNCYQVFTSQGIVESTHAFMNVSFIRDVSTKPLKSRQNDLPNTTKGMFNNGKYNVFNGVALVHLIAVPKQQKKKHDKKTTL